MHVDALTDVGLIRKDNEDNYLVSIERGLFVVADGMGGHVGGQIASRLAVQVLDGELAGGYDNDPGTKLQETLLKANDLILNYAQNEQQYSGMGTTVTAALVRNGTVYIAHIGDSRAYLYRSGTLVQLTQDHSLVNELFLNGSLTLDEMLSHPQRNILTRALGTQKSPNIDMTSFPTLPGDMLLLCTDGLHGLVFSDDIKRILAKNSTLKAKLKEMVQLSLERGGNDNITAVLVLNE